MPRSAGAVAPRPGSSRRNIRTVLDQLGRLGPGPARTLTRVGPIYFFFLFASSALPGRSARGCGISGSAQPGFNQAFLLGTTPQITSGKQSRQNGKNDVIASELKVSGFSLKRRKELRNRNLKLFRNIKKKRNSGKSFVKMQFGCNKVCKAADGYS